MNHDSQHRTLIGPQMNGGGSTYGLDDHIYQRLLRERIVFLGSEVRDQNANAICAQLLLLSAEDPEADIFLHINSPGGSVDAGMAIYDTMNYIPNDVATVGMGLAASMGQFLLCAGTKGKRYALPHARIMMHQPSGGMGGSASDIKIQAAAVAAHQEGAARADRRAHRPAARAGRSPTPTATAGSPPSRRMEYGFIDQVITSAREAADEGRPARAKAEGLTPMNYYIPQWEERTSYGFRRIDPYAKLFEDRIIFLGTPITDDVANAVMAQLLCLESMDPDQDISIYINSPGGSFTALTAIYDTMRFIKPDVQTVCLGQAASAAAVLLAAGTPGKRLALPNSRILIHQPYTEGTFGQTSDIEIQANEILRMRELLEKMIADHTGRTIEQVSRDIERDKILTAEQAVEYGLIDAVLESLKGTPRSPEPRTDGQSTDPRVRAPVGGGTGYRRGACDAARRVDAGDLAPAEPEETARGTHR